MKRFLFLFAAALALISHTAFADNLLTMGVSNIPVVTPTYTGVCDIVASCGSYFALRAATGAIAAASPNTTKLVELERTSDSHTCYFYVAGSGNGGLGNTAGCSSSGDNGSAMSSWCASTTCDVLIWYDQAPSSGPDYWTYQSTYPTIVFNCAGTTFPCVYMGGSTYFVAVNNVTATTYVTLQLVMQKVEVSSTAYGIFGLNSTDGSPYDGGGYFSDDGANSINMWASSNSSGVTASDSTLHSLIGVPGTSGSIFVDGTTTSQDSGSLGAGPWSPTIANGIGGGHGTARPKGYILEGGYWLSNSAALTSTQQSHVCENQQTYYGISFGC